MDNQALLVLVVSHGRMDAAHIRRHRNGQCQSRAVLVAAEAQRQILDVDSVEKEMHQQMTPISPVEHRQHQ